MTSSFRHLLHDAQSASGSYPQNMDPILVVDDDPTVTEVVQAYLQQAGLPTLSASDGGTAIELVAQSDPALIVLDLMMPGIDGLAVCRRVRQERPTLPIIMLTAMGEEADRIAGLEAGADDYVVKPFSPRELVLRIQSVLRRSSEPLPMSKGKLEAGDLVIDRAARVVRRAGTVLPFTAREFDLLTHFVTNPGVAFSREDLLATVWGWDFGDHSTVTVHVRRLREKIEPDPAAPTRLVTVWGTGYRWDEAR